MREDRSPTTGLLALPLRARSSAAIIRKAEVHDRGAMAPASAGALGPSRESRCLRSELIDLAYLPVEQVRGRETPQLAHSPRECPGRVSQLRSRVGGCGDDGLADDRGFVAALD